MKGQNEERIAVGLRVKHLNKLWEVVTGKGRQ